MNHRYSALEENFERPADRARQEAEVPESKGFRRLGLKI